jgi:aminoglycoside 6'-N-acetyltransferase
MELRGARVVLRPLAEEDAPRLVELGADSSVARWWPGLTDAHVRAKARGEEEGVTAFAVVVDGEAAGIIQFYEEDDPEYRHAGIDVFLGAPWQGRGLGTDAVRTLASHLLAERGHHRVIIDPAADNAAAIRSYERAGFRRVGVMREYWRDGEGVWRDGVLMDLLASDLVADDTTVEGDTAPGTQDRRPAS